MGNLRDGYTPCDKASTYGRSPMSFIISLVITTLALVIAIYLVPGITTTGKAYASALACAFALAIVNMILRPLVTLVTFPLSIITFGLFSVVINALMLQAAAYVSSNYLPEGLRIDSFGSALMGSIVVSIATMVLNAIIAPL